MLLFGLLHVGIDRWGGLRRWPGALAVAGTMSRYSLTVARGGGISQT